MEIKGNVVIKNDNLEQKSIKKIYLPDNWWNSNYSIDGLLGESTKIINLIKFNYKPKRTSFSQQKSFPKQSKWDIGSGDYFVEAIGYKNKDFQYYRGLKIKIYKYSFYAVLLFTLVVTYYISTILSEI